MQYFYTLLIVFTAAQLRAQSPDEDLRKAKLAAERLQLPANSQLQDQKKIAEKMHALISNGASRLIKNKPYSAEGTTETVQVLADGNRILRHNLTKYYRDSAGRTRREQTIEALGPSSPIATTQMIIISDPVAAVDYILDPTHKTAQKFSRFPAASDEAPHPETGEKRTIQGLECTGTKKTSTIPAGKVGNERPITIVTETWYAPAIEAVVSSTTSDPRFGQTTYTLRNLVLGEPPSDLFELPSGYTLENRP